MSSPTVLYSDLKSIPTLIKILEADGCGIKEKYEKILELYMGMSAHFQFIQTYSEKRFAKTEDLKAAIFGIGRLSPEEYALLQKCPCICNKRLLRIFWQNRNHMILQID